MARVIGVDLGARRIGLACCDVTETLASPLAVLERSGDRARDHRAIVDAARNAGSEQIVVGLPLSLDGSEGPAASAVLDEVEELRDSVQGVMAVVVHDERLTTVSAERALAAAGVRGAARRRLIDAAAAAVMLQSWLDGAR
jgi:putative Holliday junction resolvase